MPLFQFLGFGSDIDMTWPSCIPWTESSSAEWNKIFGSKKQYKYTTPNFGAMPIVSYPLVMYNMNGNEQTDFQTEMRSSI